ncbi:MAG TPA: Mur ligase family protein [Lacunisphaera sp.]|jgi:UDP-N-acetylmuramoyl-tripeptide--D-alanyl-D-alanine ligase|nr:Mur ligase family protein [Lacunisphaera sp.]
MPTFAAEKLAAWTGGHWTRIPGGPLRGFTQDTRQLAPGQVFVAVRTDKRDGHDFLGEALKRGAAAALTARKVAGTDLPQLVVTDPLAAFQRIAREHRREFHGVVVGVTGSVGKTSTKDLLALLFGGVGPVADQAGPPQPGPTRDQEPAPAVEGNRNHSAGGTDGLIGGLSPVLKTEGNLNNHLGVPLTLTRLDPEVHRFAVIEAGIGGPGEMAPLAEMIEPDHSLVTLVGPAHLEKLGSLDGVAREKSRLPAANRPGGVAVFPHSCWEFEPFRLLPNPLVVVPDRDAAGHLPARSVRFNVNHRPDRTEVTFEGRRRFTLRRVSTGMAQNAALALALASDLGVGDAALQARLADWQPSKWRGELMHVGEMVVYRDFYNANPASMADAIDAFHGSVGTELPRLYVLGCMEELGPAAATYHREVGRMLRLRRGDLLFAIGDQAGALREGLLESGNDTAQVLVVDDLAPVRERLAGFAGAVFLKGSRRYQLETVFEDHTAGTPHQG